MKNSTYWQKRAEKRIKQAHKNANRVTKAISSAYDEAIKQIDKDMDNIFFNFIAKNGLDIAEGLDLLNTSISKKEMQEIRQRIALIDDKETKERLIAEIDSQAYRARITRKQALKESIRIECMKVASIELKETSTFLDAQFKETYYRNMFDYSQRIGLQLNFEKVSKKRINEVLRNKWSNKNYSTRIWENNETFANELEKSILKWFMNGKGSYKQSEDMRGLVKEIHKDAEKQAKFAKYAAERLLRTETTYIVTMADVEAMKNRDVKKLQFRATLDLRTSKQCQEADGKIIEVDKAMPGKNVPPLHPFCRSVVIEIGELKHKTRIARDANGKNIKVPHDMTYEEWYKKYIEK